jgi:hypothetical protein
MKQIHLIFAIIVLSTFHIFGQPQKAPVYKHMAIKFSPVYLISADNTAQVGFEHRINKKSNITLNEEIGYGKATWNAYINDNEDDLNRENYRARIELRIYRNDSPLLSGRYIGYELFYKQVNGTVNRQQGRECDNGNCNYYEKLDYKASKYAFGANMKFGKQIIINNRKDEDNNIIVDLNVGFGVRAIIFDHKTDIANTGYGYNDRYGDGFFSINKFGEKDRTLLIPNISLGLNFGFVLF